MNNIRSLSLEVGNGDIWIEKVKIETTRQNNLEDLLSQNTPIATILEFIHQSGQDEETLQGTSSSVSRYSTCIAI